MIVNGRKICPKGHDYTDQPRQGKDNRGCRICRVERWKKNHLRRSKIRGYWPKKYKRIKEKLLARSAVRKALLSGRLFRLPCSICSAEPAEAHHEDYSNPLDVIWLCNSHHRALHDEKRRQASAKDQENEP